MKRSEQRALSKFWMAKTALEPNGSMGRDNSGTSSYDGVKTVSQLK